MRMHESVGRVSVKTHCLLLACKVIFFRTLYMSGFKISYLFHIDRVIYMPLDLNAKVKLSHSGSYTNIKHLNV